jgi:hypothetical protein
MSAMGYCENYLRSQLYPMEADHEATLLACMKKENLI